MNRRKKKIYSIAVSILVLVSLNFLFPGQSWEQEKNGCLTCHSGIEKMHPELELSCVFCHRGDGDAKDKETAHQGFLPNPSDLAVADQTCGKCHSEYVENVKKSLHSTSAGIISGARYLWAAQETKLALYGVREIEDGDGNIPEEQGALGKLEQIPTFSESGEHIDDYLRKECLRCHLWEEGAQRDGDYRSSGCAACHVLYADDGLSKSQDPTIPKNEPGHPIKHRLTSKIPAERCVSCHNRGARIGTSFIGTMESDPYGTPWTAEGGKGPKLHGKWYNHLLADVHYEKGMECIDCHTSQDLHGDGNIYSKKEQAVEIRCTDCHGSLALYSDLKTSQGNRLLHLKREDQKFVLTSKFDGKDHPVPQLKDLKDRDSLSVAMSIASHLEKLECYACHATWTTQCYGCHVKREDRKKQYDWLAKEESVGKWTEGRSYLRWENPVLGINHREKVSPYLPGCQAIFTYLDQEGKTVEHNKVFQTAAGFSGISQNPVNPHTTRKKARGCEECHGSDKSLGLGTGTYDPQRNKLPIDFEWERIVDEEGKQIQDTSHPGARPFNKEEMAKIKRVNTCIACHSEMDTDFWVNLTENFGRALNDQNHKKIINQILKQGAR
jgi:hypothetical protein